MSVAKTLIVLWLVAVAAMMAATAPAPAAAASPAHGSLHFSLESDPSTAPGFALDPAWLINLKVVDSRAIKTPIRDVRVQLSVEPPELAVPGGWSALPVIYQGSDNTPDHVGYLDPQTGVWTIPVMPHGGNASLRIDGRSSLDNSTGQVVVARLYAKIISSRPSEHPPTPENNETEAHYVLGTAREFRFTAANPGVALEFVADDAGTFRIRASSYTRAYHPELPRPGSRYRNTAYDVSVQYELTEGLEFAPGPLPSDVRQINDRTRAWDVGTMYESDSNLSHLNIRNLDVPVAISAFPSLEAVPLTERCLTARITRVVPAFELDATKRTNDVATLCMEDPKRVLSTGEIILWWLHDCVDVTEHPCNDADELLLLAREDGDNNITLPGHRYDRYFTPDSVIINVRDPSGREYDTDNDSVTDGTTVSWQTGRKESRNFNRDGIRVWYSRIGFNANIADWSNVVRTVSVSGLRGTTAPGRVKVRFDSSSAGTFFNPNPRHERPPFNLSRTTASQTDMFLEFETLGTYVVNFHALATRTDATEYPAMGDYVFHVGPITELAVRNGGEGSPLAPAGQMAYTIHASSNGPDTAPAVEVTLSGVPEGAESIASEGSYEQGDCGASGLCDGTWTIGAVTTSDPRPFDGKLAFPTLTLITPAGANTPDITATIANVEDYEKCIDGDGNDVPVIGADAAARKAACEATSGNSWHSTPYYDYIDYNNTAAIAARPGAGGPVPGTPERLNARTYSDPPFALVSWNPVERVNGWPVSRYEVREFAPPCQLPAPDAEATATVSGELYLDTDLDAGEDKCYAVRAVNERGIPGYWSMVSVGGDRGATMTPQSLTVAENGGTGHYTVVLDAQPRSTVAVTFASADTDVATVRSALSDSRLLFGPGNWDIPQRVTVTGVDDDIDNPDDRRSTVIRHSLSGGGYDNVPVPSVRITVTDDDGPDERPQQMSAAVSKSSLTLAEESGTDIYTVSLSHPAESPVELNFTADGPVTVSPPRHTFATGGRGPKTITVTAVDDGGEVNPGGQRPATIRHTLSGGGYGGVPVPDVSVTVLDGDVPARVSKSADSLTISEAGGSGSYTVSLNKRPTGLMTVRLSVTGADPGAVRVTPAALAFTPENWQTPQTVTVVGEDDDAVTGARHATIEHEVLGGGYDGVSLGPVAVTVSDNDVAEITLSEAVPSLSLSEAGPRSATYQVSLSSRPTSEVKVSISSDDESVVRVRPSEATFGPSDWNVPYVITVTVQGDGVDNPGDLRAATIRHEASGGEFQGVAKEIAVTVADDDEAGLRIAECIGGANRDRCSNDPGDVRWQEPGGEITWSVSEDGERQTTGMLTRQFCIALGSAPADGIWLAVESSNPSVARPVGSTTFRIDNGNWNNCVERFSADSSTGLLPLVRLMIGRPAGDGRATAEAPPVGAEATITLLIRQERDGDGAHYSEGFRAEYTLRIVE